MEEKKELIKSTPSLSLEIERSMASFINQQGVQKLHALLDCAEMLRYYMIINKGEDFTINLINEELSKVKFQKVKKYEDMIYYLDRIRKKLNKAQVIYELSKGSKKSPGSINYGNEIAKIISPFQSELYFLVMALLKVSSVQNRLISRELLKSPEESKARRDTFKKPYREGVHGDTG